jgi:hypothetical protein
MFFFKKKETRRIKEAVKEAQIQAIRQETLNTIEKTNKSVDKVNKVLSKNDIALNIYYATGGDRRKARS